MESKIYTVAIMGCGSRGLDSYAKAMKESEHFKIQSVCDFRQVRLDLAQSNFGVAEEECFLNENEFFKQKRADCCVIATQDADHVRHCIKALELGYDVLLEKPITAKKEDAIRLLKEQRKTEKKVIVCHVLRYANAFTTVAKMLDDGIIGDLIDIHAIEQVVFWHQAHSYVRGNWRKEEETSPMILAKCCHDMDLLQFYAKSKAKTVSSIGSLSFFNKEHKPEGSSERCQSCKHINTCPYSAENIYIKMWKEGGSNENVWPYNVICTDLPLTEEKLRKAYENGPYGRCVFACDNDVVDHQEVNVLFENGITANLCMTAFTGNSGRVYRFHGTYGEIDLDEERGSIFVKKYGEPLKEIKFSELPDVSGGHGGGDSGLVNALYETLQGNDKISTSLEASIESHLMCFAAEKSRHKNGKLIYIH